MGQITISGSTNGTATVATPAIAGTPTLTLDRDTSTAIINGEI